MDILDLGSIQGGEADMHPLLQPLPCLSANPRRNAGGSVLAWTSMVIGILATWWVVGAYLIYLDSSKPGASGGGDVDGILADLVRVASLVVMIAGCLPALLGTILGILAWRR